MSDNSAGVQPSETPVNQENSQEELTKERWKQQLEGTKQEAERQATRAIQLETKLINKEIAQVEANNSYFLDLFQEDPDLAEKVARQGFGVSAQEALEKVQGVKIQKKNVDADSIAEEVEKRYEHKQALKSVNKYFDTLSEEDRDMAKKKFEKLIAGKLLTTDEATEFAEMATLYVKKDSIKRDQLDFSLASMASTGLGSSVKEKKEKVTEGADDLANALGLGHLYSKK